MLVEVSPVQALSAADYSVWRQLCAENVGYASPFLCPSFARAVAMERRDLQVAIGRENGAPVMFWPFHRRPGGLLRPLATPLSDWHGPVIAPGYTINPAELVSRCGGSAVRFSALADPSGSFSGAGKKTEISWAMDLSGGAAAYRAALKSRQAKSLANTARCARKAEREIGPLRFTFQDPSIDAFERVIAWKRERFAETGKYDIFQVRWIRGLFDRLWRWSDPAFGLVVSTLHFGDRMVAGEIYLRKEDRLHAWISAFDRTLLSYAPGHILTDQMLSVADAENVRRVDFGTGNAEYKSRWCLSEDEIADVVVYAASSAGRLRASARGAWERVTPALGASNTLLAKARGRADHVFAAQGNLLGGAVALAATISSRRYGMT